MTDHVTISRARFDAVLRETRERLALAAEHRRAALARSRRSFGDLRQRWAQDRDTPHAKPVVPTMSFPVDVDKS